MRCSRGSITPRCDPLARLACADVGARLASAALRPLALTARSHASQRCGLADDPLNAALHPISGQLGRSHARAGTSKDSDEPLRPTWPPAGKISDAGSSSAAFTF